MSEKHGCSTRARSSGSARPSSRRTRVAPSCGSRSRRARRRSPTPGSSPRRSTGWSRSRADTNPEIEIAKNLGVGDLTFFSRIHHGGGAACGTIQQAVLAVNAGVADYVVVLPRVQRAVGAPLRRRRAGPPAGGDGRERALRVVRAVRAAHARAVGRDVRAALHARVRRDQRGLRPRSRSPTASTRRRTRRRGSTSSRSRSRTTRSRRWIVEPLHLLDCCQESDGGQAIVVTTPERASDLPNPPVIVRSAAQGAADRPGDDDELLPRLDHRAPRDGPDRAPALEHHRASVPTTSRPRSSTTTSRRSRSRSSRSSGSASAARRRTSSATATSSSAAGLPINTNGGQLGEAYIHGMNGIAEGVRLVRGTSTNQPDGVEHVLVTAGTMVPTSALILGKAA